MIPGAFSDRITPETEEKKIEAESLDFLSLAMLVACSGLVYKNMHFLDIND